jgi:hypothetical protein
MVVIIDLGGVVVELGTRREDDCGFKTGEKEREEEEE